MARRRLGTQVVWWVEIQNCIKLHYFPRVLLLVGKIMWLNMFDSSSLDQKGRQPLPAICQLNSDFFGGNSYVNFSCLAHVIISSTLQQLAEDRLQNDPSSLMSSKDEPRQNGEIVWNCVVELCDMYQNQLMGGISHTSLVGRNRSLMCSRRQVLGAQMLWVQIRFQLCVRDFSQICWNCTHVISFHALVDLVGTISAWIYNWFTGEYWGR